jgi:hypothetical protein
MNHYLKIQMKILASQLNLIFLIKEYYINSMNYKAYMNHKRINILKIMLV